MLQVIYLSEGNMLFSGKCGMIYLNLVKEWRQHKLHFSYCPYCGSKLIGKEIGDEGSVAWQLVKKVIEK